MPNVIEAAIINGKHKGKSVLIPRVPMISTDLLFTFRRLQYPVRHDFAMTINKAGQVAARGLNLANSCSGQLYVACPRVGTLKTLYSRHKNYLSI